MSETNRIPVEILAKALGAGADCPELARLVAAAADELPAAEREHVLAHAEGCAACGAELELARSFARKPGADETDGPRVDRRAPRPPAAPAPTVAKVLPMRPRRAPVTSARLAIWAVAACAALAVGLSFWAVATAARRGFPSGRSRTPCAAARSPGSPRSARFRRCPTSSGGIRWLAPRATGWRSSTSPTARYSSTITTAPGWTPAAADRARLETFVLYRVRVVAVDAAGGELAASEAAELRLEPAR